MKIEDYVHNIIIFLDKKIEIGIGEMDIPRELIPVLEEVCGNKYQILNLKTDKEYVLDLRKAKISNQKLLFGKGINFSLIRDGDNKSK